MPFPIWPGGRTIGSQTCFSTAALRKSSTSKEIVIGTLSVPPNATTSLPFVSVPFDRTCPRPLPDSFRPKTR